MLTRSTGTDGPSLRVALGNQVTLAGDETWDTARRPWNLACDQRPLAVTEPRTVEEVRAIVRHAAEHDLRVAPQGTGHGAATLGALDDAILLRTTHLGGVSIDAPGRRARVGAGVRWRDVVGLAARHGLAPLMGSSPDVGVAGYTLGGGVGWLGRRFGFATNAVRAIELVTADGDLVRADADHAPDLFWALRGGGGNFGVVTAIEFSLFPVAQVYAGSLFWPIERAPEVFAAWRDRLDALPREVSSSARILQFPPLPQVPDPLRGRSFALIGVACLLPQEEADALLRPWRDLAPEIDTLTVMEAPGLGTVAMDPEDPVPAVGDGMFVREVSGATIEALLAQAGPGTDSPLLLLELRHLGGALAESSPDHGVLDATDARALLYGAGLALDDGLTAAVERRLDAVQRALEPWHGGRYLNFSDRTADADQIFLGDTYRRLQEIRRRYDPRAVFQANHAIHLTAS